MATSPATSGQFAAAALPASLTARVIDSTETTSVTAPTQSMRTLLDGLDSGAHATTAAVAMAPMTAMNQNTARKP